MQQALATAPLRVFVVENSVPVRERVLAMVALAGAQAAGHATGVAEAIGAILRERPDIVILDMQLADGTGFDVLRVLHAEAPEIDVFLFTNFIAADPYRKFAERLGARGLFDKSREFERMREVVAQRVAAAN